MDSKRLTGAVVSVIGGLGLATGVFLTWAIASVDIQAFASALGIDPALVNAGDRSRSLTGLEIGIEAKWVFAAGLVVIALGLVLLVSRRWLDGVAVAIVFAGVVGAALVVYDGAQLLTQKDEAIQREIQQASPGVEALGIDPSDIADAVAISLGIGLWMCALGGVIAIVGGGAILSIDPPRRPRQDAMSGTTSTPP